MKYPFTPEVLDALPEELAELFRELELTLLREICSHLKVSGQLNEVTVQDIRALRSIGADLDVVKAAIDETTHIGMETLESLLDGVVERNQAYYTEMVDLAKVTAPDRLADERDIAAIRRQTLSAYKNITGSMGFLTVEGGRLHFQPPAKAYQWALDSAALQVQSGAFSYNHAIAEAVKRLAEGGLKTVNYESGHVDSVDVAVRRAVMTGVNQLNQKYREQSMDYLETDLVEVTAHLGARNIDGPKGWENHAAWQGKVYRWKGHETQGSKVNSTKEETQNSEAPEISGKNGSINQKAGQNRSTRLSSANVADVTDEYLRSATPGQGEITYEDGYEEGKHKNEIKIAHILYETFGGDIKLLKESNIPNDKKPDFEWGGKLWETKGTHSINSADKSLQHALKQIQKNPGGFILEILENLDIDKLIQQLTRRFLRSDLSGLDLMLIKNGKVISVLRYKK